MTKLLEWLTGLALFLGVWYAIVRNDYLFSPPYDLHAWLIPLYAVLCFGMFSLATLLFRVYTFNDCPEAAEELRMQIKEAREDLKKKGFKFDDYTFCGEH